jgi:hypothetical protein
MSGKVAIFLTNYNVPERADALYEHVAKNTKVPYDFYLTDNASDLCPPSQYTNVWIRGKNKQTTAGWLEGLKAAKASGQDYSAYIFTITSCDFNGLSGDPLEPMLKLLEDDSNAVGVHAALTADSTTSWEHLKARGGTLPRRTYMLDNLWCMYRADWFDSIGWFDPDLRYAWGVDLETCYKVRQQERSLWVHEGVQVRKVTDIAYAMDRMRMSADERRMLASQNMEFVLYQKYGGDWRNLMYNGLVESDWR